jgi:hypothetical protein
MSPAVSEDFFELIDNDEQTCVARQRISLRIYVVAGVASGEKVIFETGDVSHRSENY